MTFCTDDNIFRSSDDKIINGVDPLPNSWPFIVRLYMVESIDADNGFGCGGSVIHPHWVLTARNKMFFMKLQNIFKIITENFRNYQEQRDTQKFLIETKCPSYNVQKFLRALYKNEYFRNKKITFTVPSKLLHTF